MLHQQLIPLTEKETWDRILDGIPFGIAHTHAYNLAISYSHSEPVFLYHAWDDEGFETICPLKIRDYCGYQDITTPYGLSGFSSIGDFEYFEDEWTIYAKNQGWICGYISQHPNFVSPIQMSSKEGRTSIFCSLTPITQMIHHLHPTYRYDVRRLEEGVSVTINDPSVTQTLPSLYKETMASKNAHTLYDFTEKTFLNLVKMPETICLGAIQGETVLAIVLFTSNKEQADYFCSAALPDGRKYTKLLVWKALNELQTRGVTSVNLGGGVNEGDTLEQFKMRFGGQSVQLCAHKVIFDEVIYSNLCRDKPLAKYFPSYRS